MCVFDSLLFPPFPDMRLEPPSADTAERKAYAGTSRSQCLEKMSVQWGWDESCEGCGGGGGSGVGWGGGGGLLFSPNSGV